VGGFLFNGKIKKGIKLFLVVFFLMERKKKESNFFLPLKGERKGLETLSSYSNHETWLT
jgi:hypothetical protein